MNYKQLIGWDVYAYEAKINIFYNNNVYTKVWQQGNIVKEFLVMMNLQTIIIWICSFAQLYGAL